MAANDYYHDKIQSPLSTPTRPSRSGCQQAHQLYLAAHPYPTISTCTLCYSFAKLPSVPWSHILFFSPQHCLCADLWNLFLTESTRAPLVRMKMCFKVSHSLMLLLTLLGELTASSIDPPSDAVLPSLFLCLSFLLLWAVWGQRLYLNYFSMWTTVPIR